MSGFEHVRFPSIMRVTLPSEPKTDPPMPIFNEEYIESVVPMTPIDLLDQTTGLDIAREFEEKRKAADEAVCRDSLVYLEAGLSQTAVVELIGIRRGAEYGVTKEKIEQAVSIAVELLKQKEKSK